MLFLRLFPPTPGRSRNNGLNFLSCHLNIPFIFGNILENDHSQSCRAPEDGRCCFREEPKGELQETVMPRTQGCHHQLGCVPLWPLTSRSNRSGRLEAVDGWDVDPESGASSWGRGPLVMSQLCPPTHQLGS